MWKPKNQQSHFSFVEGLKGSEPVSPESSKAEAGQSLEVKKVEPTPSDASEVLKTDNSLLTIVSHHLLISSLAFQYTHPEPDERQAIG